VFRSALFSPATQFSPSDADARATTANGTSLLMAAADDAAKVALLLSNGVDPKYRAPSGYDAMTVSASYRGSAAAMAALIAAGADVQPPESVKIKHSPLLFASMSGDLDSVSLLLGRGASPNRRDSPLSEAITFGHVDVVRALIAAGAKVDLVESTGVNLMHWATLTNRADVIPELAKAGVAINAVDEHGYTPLMYAATIDFGDTTTIDALLASGADRTIRNASGRTPLQQAQRLGLLRLAQALRP
jgi:ankyrin repeat protein